MPSLYQVQALSLMQYYLIHITNMANEPLTDEEKRYFQEHRTYNGTSLAALQAELGDLVYEADFNGDPRTLSIKPHSGDDLTRNGQRIQNIEDPAMIGKLDAFFEKLNQRCAELKSKPSTGPSFSVLLDFVQTAIRDMKDGKDFYQELHDDPVLNFTTSAMNDLLSPRPNAQNPDLDRELLEAASDRFPFYLMTQHALDVHRKIRDFRERIDPTDQAASEAARESLKKTLDEYEETTLQILQRAESPLYESSRKRVIQPGSEANDILGARGYNFTILPLLQDYKEGLSVGVDPALLPQYSLMKRARGQLDNALATLRRQNADGRYNEVLVSARQFDIAFSNLRANADPAKNEEQMKAVCSAMNELFDKAGAAFQAHKNDLTPEETIAITNLRGTDQSYLQSHDTFNTFRHITGTVEQYYEDRHQLESAAPNSDLRERRTDLSRMALREDQEITSARQKQRAAFARYNDEKTFYNFDHDNSITGGIYGSAFQDKYLFTKDYEKYFPRLVRRFPDLANPEAADKVSVLRSAAGQYVDVLEETVRKTAENLIATRHFVKNGKLLTDKKEIAALMDPGNARNPLFLYWQYIKEARAGLKDAESVKDIQKTARQLTDNFETIQKHHQIKGDPDIAAAIKARLDHSVNECKVFAGPSDYAKYFRNRVEAIGKYCREKTQSLETVHRLQALLVGDGSDNLHLSTEDRQKWDAMAGIVNELNASAAVKMENLITIGDRQYLSTALDPDGSKVELFLKNFDALSPDTKYLIGDAIRQIDAKKSVDPAIDDRFKNNYTGEDDLRLASAENVDRFCKLALEANEAKSFLFDHQEFKDYRASLQAVSSYAEELNTAPNSTEKMFHMAELMRAAGRAAEAYLTAKGEGKRSSEVGNIRYNNAYAAFYLTAPKEATTLAQEAENLHVSAARAKDKQTREHLSLETLMREEFGKLDRTYKKQADGQGYEKVRPAPEKKGMKK